MAQDDVGPVQLTPAQVRWRESVAARNALRPTTPQRERPAFTKVYRTWPRAGWVTKTALKLWARDHAN